RIGYDAPWYNRFVYSKTVKRRFDELAEVERLLALGEPLEISGVAPDVMLELPTAKISEAEEFFRELGDGPVIGVHPGSTWETKKWPEQNFARVIDKCIREGFKSVLAQVEQADKVVDLSGKLNLQQLAAYIRQLDVYLTNDSGPMHIAWIQKVPVVAMFGPTVRRFGFFPRGADSTVLESPDNLK
ncbi:Glycosyl transferase, family 9 like protein, partial [Aduncisulcus paluster]